MTISVVIPAYNEENYIGQTIESINSLSRKPDEIIVVDGGSTDKTAQISKEFGATVISVPHRGIGFARQQGLLKTVGDIVAYTDADTRVPNNWLTVIEDHLSKPGTIGVFGSFRVPDGWWPYRFHINFVQPLLNQLLYWLGVPMAAGQNIAFLRSVALQVGGFPEDYKIAEDIEMARRLMTRGKVEYLPRLIVTSSGRRGNEGIGMITRIFKAFFLYYVFRKANKVGFPDMR